MPELRQNLATKEWVIISTERAKRPEDFRRAPGAVPARAEHSAACPFCTGNEGFSEEVHAVQGSGGWKVRVVRN
ncbi:MAG: UDPglucose--hexose-1-phosphate uridylyltransferase, partial [Elusimicrobia bacterium]